MAGRPKGFTSTEAWKPVTWDLVTNVKAVLREYSEYLPLTARQIFYRMVGQYDYDKTEQAYARLCEALVKARRARVISFSAIRDDGTMEAFGGGWDSPKQWWRGVLHSAQAYERDRMEGQPVRIEVWCEAGGMHGQLSRVTGPYSVGMFSTGGFSSVTVTYEIAQRVLESEVPMVFMHLGDYDPSGESIFAAMAEDVAAFVAGELGDWDEAHELFRPRRVALTQEQVQAHNLPTAPPKRTDSRSARWVGDTCQLEAMDPATIAGVLTEAIEGELDLEQRQAVMDAEDRERGGLVSEIEKRAA